jgi:helicase
MKHGIKRELIPLIRIRNIGRVRARRLFNNGFMSPEIILAAGEERISPILGQSIASQVIRDLRGTDTREIPLREADPQANLFQFGEDREE